MLTSGYARNALWNLAGQVFPLAGLVVATPILVGAFGVAGFALVNVSWLLAGYMGIFELGLGRAITRVVAAGDDAAVGQVWMAVALMALAGGVAGIGLVVGAPALAALLKPPQELEAETITSVRILGVAVPMITTASAFRGVLEGKRRFRLVNLVRAPLGTFVYIAPLFALRLTDAPSAAVGAVVAVRGVTALAYLALCLHLEPRLRLVRLDYRATRSLVTFGGWLTVSNVINPVLTYIDRFLIATLVSLSAFTYYASAYDVAVKASAIPVAVASALFPVAVALQADRARNASKVYGSALVALFVTLAPLSVALASLAGPLFGTWLGSDFERQSAPILRVLAVGVLVNGLAHVPTTFLQAGGRPDLTGKFHLLELPLYLGLLLVMLPAFGPLGAAFAWLIRISVDATVLHVATARSLPVPLTTSSAGLAAALTVGLLSGAFLPLSPVGAVLYVALASAVLAVFSWRRLIQPEDRRSLLANFAGRYWRASNP